MKHIIDTERLYLRQLTFNDKNNLAKVLSDKDSMKFYPHPFSEKEVEDWINWNINNYKKHGFGLWAVILKNNNIFLGDCGITIQEINESRVPEIGYHIIKNYNGRGYATEAAIACKEYAFNILKLNIIYSYMTVDNIPSQKVAQKCGMEYIGKFNKLINNITVEEMIYCIDNHK